MLVSSLLRCSHHLSTQETRDSIVTRRGRHSALDLSDFFISLWISILLHSDSPSIRFRSQFDTNHFEPSLFFASMPLCSILMVSFLEAVLAWSWQYLLTFVIFLFRMCVPVHQGQPIAWSRNDLQMVAILNSRLFRYPQIGTRCFQ